MSDDIIRIPLETIASSNLAAMGYDPERQRLAVQFKNGSIFYYADIDPGLALEMYAAESRGRFYSERIKGKYTGRRVTGPCPKCGDEGWIGDRCEDCGTATYVEKERTDAVAK
jgi:hypothetical protein